MILSTEFKKQISKPLAEQLKVLGFKGSGFHYIMDTDDYVFTIGIQPDRYGGQCCAEFGIQPKALDYNSIGELNFKKLKYYDCELRTRISPNRKGDHWWKYSNNEKDNVKIANQIAESIKTTALPVIQLLIDNPHYFETIEPSDLDKIYEPESTFLLGIGLATTGTRLAWMLAVILEKVNLKKAKAFANYVLPYLNNPDTFFGMKDLKRVLSYPEPPEPTKIR